MIVGMNSPCQAWDYQASDEYTPLDETESRGVVCVCVCVPGEVSLPILNLIDIHRPPISVPKVNTRC